MARKCLILGRILSSERDVSGLRPFGLGLPARKVVFEWRAGFQWAFCVWRAIPARLKYILCSALTTRDVPSMVLSAWYRDDAVS